MLPAARPAPWRLHFRELVMMHRTFLAAQGDLALAGASAFEFPMRRCIVDTQLS